MRPPSTQRERRHTIARRVGIACAIISAWLPTHHTAAQTGPQDSRAYYAQHRDGSTAIVPALDQIITEAPPIPTDAVAFLGEGFNPSYSAPDHPSWLDITATNGLVSRQNGALGHYIDWSSSGSITLKMKDPNSRTRLAADSYTITGWFKASSRSSYNPLLSFSTRDPSYTITAADEERGPRLGINADGLATLHFFDDTIDYDYVWGPSKHSRLAIASKKRVDDSSWHHFAITYDTDTLTLYIDGLPQGQEELSSSNNLKHLHAVHIGEQTVKANSPTIELDTQEGRAVNSTITTSAAHDELFIYPRALAPRELQSLIHKRRTGLIRVWPFYNQQLKDIFNRNITDATTRPITPNATSAHTSALRSIQPPSSSSDTFFSTFDGVQELKGMTSYTVGAWLYIESEINANNAGKLLGLGCSYHLVSCRGISFGARYTQGKGAQLEAIITGGSSFNAITLTPSADSNAALPVGRWFFAALSADRDAQRFTLSVDGHPIASKNSASSLDVFSVIAGYGFNSHVNIATQNVRVGWVGLYNNALDPDTLAEQRLAGPTVWLDGQLTADNQPKDRSSFGQVVFQSGQRVFQPLIRYTGKAQDTATSNATTTGLMFDQAAGTAKQTAIIIDAVGPLADESFSFYAHIPNAAIQNGRFFPLIYRSTSNPSWYTPHLIQAVVTCHTAQCQLDVILPNRTAPDPSRPNTMQAWKASFPRQNDDMRIAISFDGTHAYATYNGTILNLAYDPAGRLFGHDNATIPTGHNFYRIGLQDSDPYMSEVTFKEVKLYARPLPAVELASLTQTCDTLRCAESGRSCSQAPDQLGTPVCAQCSAGFWSAISGPDLPTSCHAPRGLGQSCISDAQCGADQQCTNATNFLSGTYRDERGYFQSERIPNIKVCVAAGDATSQSAQDTRQYCDLLNRSTETSGAFHKCGSCKEYFTPPSTDPFTLPCLHSPDPNGEVGSTRHFDNPDFCQSRALLTITDEPYNARISANNIWDKNTLLSTYWGSFLKLINPYLDNTITGRTYKVCSATDQQQCERVLKRRFNLATNTCTSECAGGLAPAWSIISPQLCKKLYTNMHPFEFTPYWDPMIGHILYQPQTQLSSDRPSLERLYYATTLKQNLDGKPPHQARAELEAAGFGEYYLTRMIDGLYPVYTWRGHPKYNREPSDAQLRLSECMNPNSIFNDPEWNYQTCKPARQSNGARCPPASADPNNVGDPNNTCISGYCARDTKTCQDGNNVVERMRGTQGNEAKDGKDDASFAINRHKDGTVMVQETGNGQREYETKASVGFDATFFGKKFDIMSINPTIKSTSTGGAQVTSYYTFFGVDINAPMPSTTSACAGAGWDNGSFSAPNGCEFNTDVAAPSAGASFCFPMPESLEDKLSTERIFLAGPVPITVKASVTIDACIASESAAAPDGDLSFGVRPSLGVGVDMRGGVGGGIDGVIEVFAGVRAVITLIEVAFPVVFVLETVIAKDGEGQVVPNMFKIRLNNKVSAEFTLLSLLLSVFAETGVGPFFSFEVEFAIFEFGGFVFSQELANTALTEFNLDFNIP